MICLFILAGCAVKKNATNDSLQIINKEVLLNKINTLNNTEGIIIIKGSKISIEDNETITNLKVNLMIKKDSAILVSVSSLLGIEVSRALILPDSIIVIDRLNKTYYKEKYNELEQRFSIALDFYKLQNALIADFYDNIKFNIDSIDDVLRTEKGNFIIPFSEISPPNMSSLTNLVVDNKTFLVSSCNYNLNKKEQEYQFEYADYLTIDNFTFPRFIEMEFSNRRSKIKMAIQHKNVKLHSNKNIDLVIPDNYLLSQ
ncbi:MAG: DUF4292 domain-containing protein [Bacteroidales bacterium]